MRKKLLPLLFAIGMLISHVFSFMPLSVYAADSGDSEPVGGLATRAIVKSGLEIDTDTLSYNGADIGNEAFIEIDGVTYPAFCVDPNLPGAHLHPNKEYPITITGTNNNPKVATVLHNTVPYKTSKEVCDLFPGLSDLQIYAATKAAVRAVDGACSAKYPDDNLWKGDPQTVAFTKHLINLAKNATEDVPELTIYGVTDSKPVELDEASGYYWKTTNLVRQNFIYADLGENKAKLLAERYATAFGMGIEYIPDFIEDDARLAELVTSDDIRNTYVSSSAFVQGLNTAELRRSLVILIGCVDNNKSRQMCHRIFNQAEELIYIDSGNGEYTGQVVCGIRRKKRTYYKPVGDVYPDILLDKDKFPTELSCAEASVSAPQSITANIMAATAIVYGMLQEGVIEALKIGRAYKIPKLNLIKYLQL